MCIRDRGGSTVEAQEKVAEDVALQVLDVLNDRPARYAVNAPIIPPRDLELLVPYIDLAERMGRFMKQLGAQGMGDVEFTAEEMCIRDRLKVDVEVGPNWRDQTLSLIHI